MTKSDLNTDTPASPAPDARSRVRRAFPLALLVVLFGTFIDLVDATIVVIAAPAIKADLGASDAQLQWVVAAYTLALGSGLITGGRLGDAVGRRRMFLIGLAAFGVASVLCAISPTPEALIAFRALQGIAGGVMVPQVFGIIRGSFDPGRRARALGAYGAVQGLASVAGPLLGGLLVSADLMGSGWRAVFWINVPIVVLALIVGIRTLPESRSEGTARFDLVGAVLAAGGLLLLLLPLVQATSWGWSWLSVILIAAGVVLLAGFVLYERGLARRGGEPVFDPALLRSRALGAGLAAATLFFSGIGSLFLVLSVYLQSGVGRTALETGLAILPYAIGSVITSGLGVALAARAGRLLLVIGSLVVAASDLVLWAVVRNGDDPGFWPLAGGLFLGGLGLGLVVPILVNVALAGVPGRHAGAAGGVLSTAIQIGGAVGIATLATTFFAALGRDSAANPTPLEAYGSAFGVVLLASAGLYGVTALAMLLLPRAAAAPTD